MYYMHRVFSLNRVLLCLGVLVFSVGACKKKGVGGDESLLGAPQEYALALLEQHNYARTQPKEYAEKVLKPNMNQPPTPNEKSLYETLISMAPAPALVLDDGALAKAAQWFAQDHTRTKTIGHTGSDGSSMSERIQRAAGGTYNYSTAENCSYGRGKNAVTVTLAFLIDEGVASLGHRKNILNPEYRRMGVGYCDAQGVAYGNVTVIDYSDKEAK